MRSGVRSPLAPPIFFQGVRATFSEVAFGVFSSCIAEE
jgi:hypothetical protein